MSDQTKSPQTPGERIRAARLGMGLTQADLAQRVGVTKAAVSHWERGAVDTLRLGHIEALADALRMTVAEIMGGPADADAEPRSPEADWINAVYVNLPARSRVAVLKFIAPYALIYSPDEVKRAPLVVCDFLDQINIAAKNV